MTEPLQHPAVWSRGDFDSLVAGYHSFAEADPDSIRETLENQTGVVLLKGFPIEDHDQDSARKAFREWTASIGTPLSQNEQGDTIFDVADAGFGKNDPRTRGPNTNRKLSFHTDRCDVIAFLCWRQARSGGENQLVSSLHLYNEIARRRPDLLDVLMQPFVYKRHTVDLGNEQAWCEQPIFSFQDGHFACSFLRVLIDRAHADPELPDLTKRQIEAMDFLEAVADEPGCSIALRQEPGDVLLLNNWVTLHRRSEFVDHESAKEKRCLFRIWLSMPNSRPLDPRFQANFGATAAGALRGGFRTLT